MDSIQSLEVKIQKLKDKKKALLVQRHILLGSTLEKEWKVDHLSTQEIIALIKQSAPENTHG